MRIFSSSHWAPKRANNGCMRNHERLQVPLRSHLGATINFQAGTVKRAPYVCRNWGSSGFGASRKNRSLFGRYWHDGGILLRLLLTRVLPLAVSLRWHNSRAERRHDFVIVPVQNGTRVTLQISGDATTDAVTRRQLRFARRSRAMSRSKSICRGL